MEFVTLFHGFKLPDSITFQTFAFELLELKLDGESEKLEYKVGRGEGPLIDCPFNFFFNAPYFSTK